MTNINLAFDIEVEADFTGKIEWPDPSVGLGMGVEELFVEGMAFTISGHTASMEQSSVQKTYEAMVRAAPSQTHFLVARGDLQRLCAAMPEWLDELILKAKEDEAVEAICEAASDEAYPDE